MPRRDRVARRSAALKRSASAFSDPRADAASQCVFSFAQRQPSITARRLGARAARSEDFTRSALRATVSGEIV